MPYEIAKRSAAMFILKTTEKNKLPLSSMDTLATDVCSLISNAVHQVEERLTAALSEANVDTDIIHQICSEDAILNPFVGLESTYLHTKYLREELDLNVSMYSSVYN